MTSTNNLDTNPRRSLGPIVWDWVLLVGVVLFALTFVVAPLAVVWRDQGALIAGAIAALLALVAWAQARPLLQILKTLNETVHWRIIARGIMALWILVILAGAWAVYTGYAPFL